MGALTLLLGLQRANLARLGLALALFALALVLVIAAFGRLVEALHLALLVVTAEPAFASLITGLILLALALLLAIIARRHMRRRTTTPEAAALGAGAEVTAQLVALIRRNPRQAAMIATVAGVVVGALPDVRRAIGAALNVGQPERRPQPPPDGNGAG